MATSMRRRITHRIRVFNDAYPLIGPLFWLLSIQYYIVQLTAAAAWQKPFSLLHNTISDLGNTACAPYGVRDVCSPLYPLMNTSFIVLGLTIVLGSLLIYEEFLKSRLSKLAFNAMGLSGLGSMLVGLFPENTISLMHISGAALSFVLGNLALIGFAICLRLPRWFAVMTAVFGIVGLVALVLFMKKIYLGLDIGGMERIVAYPQSIWLMLFGAYMWRSRYAQQVRRR